jgi:GT2 family glycosyltransferase
MPPLPQQPRTARPAASTPPAASPWRPAWVQSLTNDGPIDVTVCVANWNCREHLRRCLESLHDQPQGVRVETVVVDNASSDGAAEMVAEHFPEVVLVRNSENRGFARASNQAAARARGRFLFFLNNDTVVPAGTLRRLLDFAEANPHVGMIGPALCDGDGTPQVSYRRRPTVGALLHRTTLLRWTGLLRGKYRRYRREDFQPDRARRVEALMGAAVFLPRAVFEECDGWDERFDFGGEDIDLSARVGRTRPVVYLPGKPVTHFGRVSSRKNVTFAAPNVAIGYVHVLRKSGTSEAALWLYKAVVTADLPVQLAGKLGEWAARRLRGRAEKAARSGLAVAGLWRLLTRDLGRFWRA